MALTSSVISSTAMLLLGDANHPHSTLHTPPPTASYPHPTPDQSCGYLGTPQ